MKLSIHHIDVGQGDATLITLRNTDANTLIYAALIDVGDCSDAAQVVLDYCKTKLKSRANQEIHPLDDIIISHYDYDHIGGKTAGGWKLIYDSELISGKTRYFAPSVFHDKKHRNIIKMLNRGSNSDKPVGVPEKFKIGDKIIDENGLTITIVAADGKAFNENEEPDSRITVWKSDVNKFGPDNQNSVSIALLLRFGDFVYFTGGDIPSEGEAKIAEGLPKTTIISALKISHHGSDGSSCEGLMKKCAKNAAAIISVGMNTHQHPRPEAVNRMINRQTGNPMLTFMTGLLDREQITALGMHSKGTLQKYTKVEYQTKNNINSYRPAGAITLRIQANQNFYRVCHDTVLQLQDPPPPEIFLNQRIEAQDNAAKEVMRTVMLSLVQANLSISESYGAQQKIIKAVDDMIRLKEAGDEREVGISIIIAELIEEIFEIKVDCKGKNRRRPKENDKIQTANETNQKSFEDLVTSIVQATQDIVTNSLNFDRKLRAKLLAADGSISWVRKNEVVVPIGEWDTFEPEKVKQFLIMEAARNKSQIELSTCFQNADAKQTGKKRQAEVLIENLEAEQMGRPEAMTY